MEETSELLDDAEEAEEVAHSGFRDLGFCVLGVLRPSLDPPSYQY